MHVDLTHPTRPNLCSASQSHAHHHRMHGSSLSQHCGVMYLAHDDALMESIHKHIRRTHRHYLGKRIDGQRHAHAHLRTYNQINRVRK